jgi:hypothetical protein
MTNRPYWPGSSSFFPGDTPFGFYDYDYQFQQDADKVAQFCASKLGYPVMDVELTANHFYAAFEQAVTTYGNEIYLFKIRDNYLSLEGSPTGSLLNNTVVQPSLQSVIQLSETYGEVIGVGGYTNWYTGSLELIKGQQDYDMNKWAEVSASLAPGDSIRIQRVFYESPPAMLRYFDPHAGTGYDRQGMLNSFGWGQYSTAVSFMMFPLYFDIQRIQSIEMSDHVRRSAYSFELVNNRLRLFPVPGGIGTFYKGDMLRFEYTKRSEEINPGRGPYSYYSGSELIVPQDRITNAGNVPYANPVYEQINAPGRYWIYEYTAAIAKEMLGYVRGKYATIPIPGEQTTLNSTDLLSDARTEKEKLIEKLRLDLDQMTRQSQLERKQAETVAVKGTLTEIPMMIFIA